MAHLIVYGSLMHRAELERHALASRAVIPARIRGYRRDFCQEPSWRASEGENRAVLNVHPAADHWFNGVIIPDFVAQDFVGLDHRERGYTRETVDLSRITPYASDSVLPDAECYLYVGRSEKYNASILPNEAYLRICMEGAREWGDAFSRDFLDTTWIQGRVPLSDYIARAIPARASDGR